MKRRKSLQVIAAAAVGTFALGYWAKDLDYIRDIMSKSFFKPTEQDLIMSISDTIIPNVEGYGAVELGVPIYLLKYFEKCIDTDEQQNLKNQLAKLDGRANEVFDHDFNECTQEQRESLLIAFEQSEDEDEKNFYKELKNQTIRGFLTTEEVKTVRYHYKLAPRHYTGCMDISEPSTT